MSRIKTVEERLDDLERDMKDNSEMTREIRDLLRAAKVGFAVLKVLGMIATSLAAIAATWSIFHGGKL